MKDRERLEELINRKPSRWGNLTIKEFERDIKILQKQAEEKRELEEKLKWLQSDFEEIKRMAEDHRSKQLHLEQQNKQYEEAFRRIKRDYAVQNVDYIPVTALYEIQLIIDQALQSK